MITVEARPGAALRLGYTGENLARRVRIPVGGWLQLYGRDGVFVLTVVRDGEVTPYPAVLEQEGDNLFWEIRGEDVAVDGTGECQLQYIVDGVVAKEEKWVTTVEPSMDAPGEYPEPPEKGWLQQVAQDGASARTAARLAGEHAETASRMAAAAEKSAEAVLDMEVQAESLPEGYEATVMKTAEDGVVRLKFGIPAGQKGDRGDPGYTPVKGKDYYTEADKQEIAEQAAELVNVPEGGGGTTDHSKLTNRDAADQHPIEAITGLADALKEAGSGGGVTAEEVDEKIAEAIEAIPNPSWNDLTDKPFGEGDTPWVLVASARSNASSADINFSAVEGRKYRLDVEDDIYNTVEASNIAPCTTSQMMGFKYYQIGSSVDVVHGDGGTANTVWRIYTAKRVASGFYRFKIYEESDTVKTLDEKYIPDSIARVADIPTKLSELENDSGFLTADYIPEGGGSVSWNDITDKPFGEVPVFDIEWDGNMDGKFVLDMSMLGYEKGFYLVKVSDIVPIEGDLVGSIGHRITWDGYHSDFQVTPNIIDTASFPGVYNIGTRVVVVHNQSLLNSAIGAPDGYVTNGTYFPLREGKDYVSRFTSGAKITKLDEKSIPTAVPVIQTAQIGQTIVVKAVDENGKPTEWEAADLPVVPDMDTIAQNVIAKLPIYNGEVESV